MKFKGRIAFIVLVLAEAVLAFNCGQKSPNTSLINSNEISISVSPTTSAVMAGHTLQLTATVTGSSKTDVTWSIAEPSGIWGHISSTGLYESPDMDLMKPVTIEAESVADPLKKAFAKVWVIAPGTVSTTKNPLVADYSITAPDGAKVKVEFGPDTSYGRDTWFQPAPSGGGTVDIEVAGMRASSAYHMRAVIDLPDGTVLKDRDHTFQTLAIPSNLIPQISVTHTPGMTPSGGVEMLSLLNGTVSNPKLEAVVTDLDGNIIWYYEFPEQFTTGAFPFPMRKPLANGNILINLTPPGNDGTGIAGDLREIDLAGNTIRDLSTAELNTRLANAGFSLHVKAISHDILPLPNGHVILIVNYYRDYNGTQLIDDALVDLDPNWQPVWTWDTFNHLDINRRPENWPDWTHANAVLYSPDDGDLILSLRHQNWIIKIDYEDGTGTGDVLWRLGFQGDFKLEGGTSPQDWFFAQHGPEIISPSSAGIFSMAVFDNGDWRRVDNAGDECGTAGQPACHSRVPIFQIDEATKTATITWVDDLAPTYSNFGGNAERLPNGDMEFDICNNGGSARVMEVTPEPTPQTVWQLDVTGQQAYRAFRIPSLYPGVQW